MCWIPDSAKFVNCFAKRSCKIKPAVLALLGIFLKGDSFIDIILADSALVFCKLGAVVCQKFDIMCQ